jgi:hypothetical protein
VQRIHNQVVRCAAGGCNGGSHCVGTIRTGQRSRIAQPIARKNTPAGRNIRPAGGSWKQFQSLRLRSAAPRSCESHQCSPYQYR